jgi:8-oxo-dGTP pyrophosphatase MutT (NUDIX family)
MPLPDVRAAGAVVIRKGGDVLLVHRPKYDDWSFPKGKLDPGEHVSSAAVREVLEETGVKVRLGPPLPPHRYGVGNGRMKSVSYWVARVVGDDDVSSYVPNNEIDRVQWFPWEQARARLSYRRDRDTLGHARSVRKRTVPLVLLRHGEALKRKAWDGDDRLRPLADEGRVQARELVPLLDAFGITAVHSSSSTRCIETVRPFADASGCPVTAYDVASEEGATLQGIVDLVDSIVDAREPAVLCSHRPLLPTVFDALGVPNPGLDPAQLIVLHLRKGRIVAVEDHRAKG